MDRIVIAAHKGGSGKTTTAVNLAASYGEGPHKVLVVDTDPQGAAAVALGITVLKPTLYEVLSGQCPVEGAIVPSSAHGVDVLPADLDLAGAEVELPRREGWQGRLWQLLSPLAPKYDMVIIDTPPGLGVLSYAALSAATMTVVTCPLEFLAFRSIPHVQETSARAGVRVLGIAPTMTTTSTRHAKEVQEALEEQYGRLVLPGIPRRVVFSDAALAGRPVTRFAPISDGAQAVRDLAREVMIRVSTKKAVDSGSVSRGEASEIGRRA